MKIPRRTFFASLALATAPALLQAQDLSDLFPEADPATDPKQASEIAPVVTSVALQAQGELMATAGDDHLVRVWEMKDGKLLHRLQGHTDWVRSVSFHPSGKTLATASNDRRVLIWDPKAGKQIRVLVENDRAIAKIKYNPAGTTLATVGFNDQLRVYNAETGEPTGRWDCPCPDMREIAFSSDGQRLAAGGRSGVIRIYNAANGAIERDIPAHKRRIRGLEFTKDGRSIVSISEDGTLKISPLEDAPARVIPRQAALCMSLKLIDDNLAAVGASDNSIRIFDLRTLKEARHLRGHTGSVVALDYRDGTLLSGSYDTTVRSWAVSQTIETARKTP